MAREKLLINSRRNYSKAQRDAKQQAENMIVTNVTKPKANEIVKSNGTMNKMFNRIRKLNEHFTEADSIALNTLIFNLYIKTQNEQKLISIDLDDENYTPYLIRLEKINKQINESMKQLCLPLNSRMSLANDMAKIMIEEKKLQQIEQQNKPQEINPILALLEADDDE
jgi:hypothetical protein